MKNKLGFVEVPAYLISCLHKDAYFELVEDLHYSQDLSLKRVYELLESQYESLGFPKRWASYASFQKTRILYWQERKRALSSAGKNQDSAKR